MFISNAPLHIIIFFLQGNWIITLIWWANLVTFEWYHPLNHIVEVRSYRCLCIESHKSLPDGLDHALRDTFAKYSLNDPRTSFDALSFGVHNGKRCYTGQAVPCCSIWSSLRYDSYRDCWRSDERATHMAQAGRRGRGQCRRGWFDFGKLGQNMRRLSETRQRKIGVLMRSSIAI